MHVKNYKLRTHITYEHAMDLFVVEEPSAFSLFMSACVCATEFLSSQVGYVREQFIIHLVDEALAVSIELMKIP